MGLDSIYNWCAMPIICELVPHEKPSILLGQAYPYYIDGYISAYASSGLH